MTCATRKGFDARAAGRERADRAPGRGRRLVVCAGTGHHRFWADSVSLLDGQVIAWRAVLGACQVTDAYLLALAVREGGRFFTFDRSVSLGMVQSATADHLAVI